MAPLTERSARLFIHLSDIHFRRRLSATAFDLDSDLRNELLLDVERRLNEVGAPADAIIVTGDVGFSGHADEYRVAADWLGALAERARAAREAVWTTPGNHDVDRSVYGNSAILRQIHQVLRTVTPEAIDARMAEFLRDELGAEVMFKPLAAYNEFAARLQCAISATRLAWHSDLVLNDGSVLRLVGLNSALVSNEHDDDGANRLILGGFQTTLPRAAGLQYMTACHHPPTWLRDQDAVDEALNARVQVQLYGHKHRQRLDRINNTLRVSAGAVHPDRREPLWEPRYNIIKVEVVGASADRRLRVTVHPRAWNPAGQRFGADFNSCGGQAQVSFDLPLDPWDPPPVPTPATPQGPAATAAPAHAGSAPQHSSPPARERIMDPERRLTYDLLGLPFSQRVLIATELEIWKDEDRRLPDSEFSRALLQRAREQKKLEKLWKCVQQSTGGATDVENPFAGA